ncbi:hypothetical protein Aduo_010019 [Ancylostoma duodenale]
MSYDVLSPTSSFSIMGSDDDELLQFSSESGPKWNLVIPPQENCEPLHFKRNCMLSQVFEKLQELRSYGLLTDVTLVIEDKEIKAHKVVLAAAIPYFYTLFTDVGRPAEEVVVLDDPDMHYGSVEYLVSSCYSGELIVPAKEVRSLMITANALELDDVKEKCADVLVSWLNPVNALEIKAFCGTLGCRKAVEECILSIQKHFVPITRSASFLKLSVDDLIAILEMDEIHVDAEESVYEAAARWLEADPGRAKHTWRVLKCARLSLVKPSFLVYVVSQHPLIREDLRCRDLVDEAKNCHLVLDGYIAPSLHSNPRFCKNMPGLVYVIGGHSKGKPMNTLYIYNQLTKDWKKASCMNYARRDPAIALCDSKVYAIGGLDTSGRWDAFECYDVREDKWEKLQPLSRKTCSLVAAAVGEKVYLLGGDNGRSAYSEVMVYSPSTTLWSPCCPMNAPRTGAAVAVLDGFIYVIGGCSGSTVYDSVIRYSPKEGKWEDMPSMTESRCWCAASILNGKIYVCGGSTTNIYHGDPGCYLNSVECFDPKTSSWSSVTPMKRERFHVALVAGPDSLYAIGGSDSDAPSMEIYHETTNEWELQPLPDNFPTRGAGAVVLPMPVDELC